MLQPESTSCARTSRRPARARPNRDAVRGRSGEVGAEHNECKATLYTLGVPGRGYGAARALLAAALLGLASGAAQAQLSCNPAAPRTDPGAGFVPFGAAEQMVARGGNAGPAWEWAIGTDTEGSQSAKGSLDWVSGKLYAWTLVYNGAGAATIEVRDAGSLVLSRTWSSGMDTGNALQVQVSTNPSLGPGTTMAATVGSINGQALSGAISQSGNYTQAEQNLYWSFRAWPRVSPSPAR